jgi:murein DD-endopeptidase MepM/ murein hydrolase activator NlpD
LTPSATPVAYFFPIQPADVASYIPGHHDYPATDIIAPEGSQFVAVTAGEVNYVTYSDMWEPSVNDPATRGGLSVAIVGFDGIRYYGSHLSAIAEGIAPGVIVTAGQILGYTGNSGNALNVQPHLHFGISRPTNPLDWQVRRGEIDPYSFLEAWAAGEPLVPQLP